MVLRKSLLSLLLFVLITVGSASAATLADDAEWGEIAPGIEFRKYQLPDPNNVFVARMDRSNPSVTIDSTIAQGKIMTGRETVSSMFDRYDQALNFWGGSTKPPTWGMRNQVVVAINGSYFDLKNGIPQGGQVQSGWYTKRFDDLGGWGGFSWKLDRSAFISECLYHNRDKQFITYPATGKTQPITGINSPRGPDELVIFTPQYDSQTGTDNSGIEVLVEMNVPTMIYPGPASASGIVKQIRVNEGNSLIPFNSIVISAGGTAAQMMLENIQVGSAIGISQEITSFEKDCSTPYSISWTKTFASIQGAFFFLKDGQIQEFNDLGATRRNPRTAIAYNDQYIFYVVVDGRDTYHSVGMSISELAYFIRDILGANWGVAQDGGGSSTMVINGKVVNNSFCNIFTCSGNYSTNLPLDMPVDPKQADLPAGVNVVSSPAGIERPVANGMLMVIAQPEEYSYSLKTGDTVATIYDAEMRLGPGTNYAAFTVISTGTNGRIVEQMNGLNGILAKSTYWWYVDFGSVTGWVQEDALVNLGPDFSQFDWFILH